MQSNFDPRYDSDFHPPAPRSSGSDRILIYLLMVLIGIVIYQNFVRPLWISWVPVKPAVVVPRGDLAADEKDTIKIFNAASPSVVHIKTSALRRDFFTRDVFAIPQGTGTGIVWDDQGHIVTNFHVIADADTADITMADQTTWKARLVGAAPDVDLAVLKIDSRVTKLQPLPVGTSNDLQVGQKVFAIGNPFGLDQSLSMGLISALDREISAKTGRTIKDVIQTDAAINPGNSGGPLLDSSGRLIGVNTAIISPSGAYSGIGFAIPVDTVNQVVPRIINKRRSR